MAAVPLHFRTLRNLSRILDAPISSKTSCLRINAIDPCKRSLVAVSLRNFSSDDARESSPNVAGSQTESKSKRKFELSFEDFQKLRKKLRSRQRVAGLPVAAVALLTSSAVSAYVNPNMFDAPPDQIQLIMGVDPIIFCGLCGVASAGVGYFVGSAMFGTLWRFFNKETAQILQERESDFLERITSKRASSFSKFEDDYYGESIKNLSDYRQWLREQQKKQKASESLERKTDSEQSQERTAEVQ